MACWVEVYRGAWTMGPPALLPQSWHAHEMIYGYVYAVIAGFLLTAVRNWTKRDTAQGYALGMLVLLWLLARLAWLTDALNVWGVAALADLLWAAGLLFALSRPIVQARQWKQLIVLSKVALLLVGNCLCYLGLWLGDGTMFGWGLDLGFYVTVAYIVLISSRVMPFFIEKGTGVAITRDINPYVVVSSQVCMMCFVIAATFTPMWQGTAVLAAIVCLLHARRMVAWHCGAIWKKPMLWVLYLANLSIVLGFALVAASLHWSIAPMITLHVFAVGGIGLMSLGMMARVSLGHTGRDIYQPPRATVPAFVGLLMVLAARVLLPLVWPQYYVEWMRVAQLLWVVVFTVFALAYVSMWVTRRQDDCGA